MITGYEEIVRVNRIADLTNPRNFSDIPGLAYRERRVLPASDDNVKVLLVNIDSQNDFMEKIGSMGVTGSNGDIERTTRWLYKNGHKVTRTMGSLDTHTKMQIFFPCWWRDADGNEPDPYTIISYDDLITRKWIPNFDKKIPHEKVPNLQVSYCEHYLWNLENAGKNKLCIWPYHTLIGTDGAKVETELSRMIYFHSMCRKNDPIFIRKGMDPWSEMYSIIKPEWSLDRYINMPVLKEMRKYDIIIFTGQASSHCVGLSGIHTMEWFRHNIRKQPMFVFLKDCMSPVKGYENTAEEFFKVFEEEYGALVVNSTDFVL